ncbi:hypothetical protein [Streptomyces abyssalis]|nr:hypothetical protein [Streptomyces abyssalis]
MGEQVSPAIYEYKKRVGAWGMIVRLTAELSIVDDSPAEGERVQDKDVWIRFTATFPATEREWITYDLSLVATQLTIAELDARSTLVTVHDLEIPLLTDYQEEASALAMIGWLRENAGIRGIDIPVDFDKDNNRYVCDWGGTDSIRGE